MKPENIDPTKPIVVSSGARSEAGKAISSRNATKHGLCATETLILPNENIADFQALEATWLNSYSPQDEAETHLIHQLAQADWVLQRANRTYTQVEAKTFATQPDPTEWTEQQHKTLTRFLRYRTAHTNTVAKLRKAIEDYRRNRSLHQLRDEKLSLTQVRLKAVQEKHKPEPTWKEHLEGMRQKAIALGYTPPELPKR